MPTVHMPWPEARGLSAVRRRVAVLLLLSLLPLLSGSAGAVEVSGTLAGNTTWSNTAEPYVINNFSGPLIVPAGVTLTVGNGVTVNTTYSNKSTLSILGTVNATGATFNLQTSDSAAGGRQSVLVSATGACTLTRCSIAVQHVTATLNSGTRLFTVQGSGHLTLAGSSLVTGVAGPKPTYQAIWAEGAAVVAVGAAGATRSAFSGFPKAIYCASSAGLTVGSADFSGSAADTGIEFANAAADLALTGDSFTGFGTAVRVPQVRNLTLTSTTITNAQPSLTSIGVYTATLTGFSATSSTISRQRIGVRVEHAHRGIDTSGIAFSANQYNVYAEGEYVMPDVTENTTLLPGDYIVDNSGRPVRVHAGVTLTIPAGVTIANKDPTYALFQVEGQLVATGATFDLKTYAVGTGGIDVVGTGVAALTACVLTASDAYASSWGEAHALRLKDSATGTVAGCDFTTTAKHGFLTRFGILIADAACLLIQDGAGNRSTFSAFPYAISSASLSDVSISSTDFVGNATGLSFSSDANLLLDNVDFETNTTGIELDNVGILVATDVTVRGCAQGLIVNSRTLGADISDVAFSSNASDVLLRGNFTLFGTAALSPCVYGVDVSAGPITIAAGATLTIPSGCVVRSTGSPWLYNLFRVDGALEAEGASFDVKTYAYDNSSQGTRVFEFAGNGAGAFTRCSFTASDIGASTNSRIFHLRDAASLTLAGCSLSSTMTHGARTCYGLVAEGNAALVLTGSGGTPTTFTGFPVGLLWVGSGDFSASQTTFTECEKAIPFAWDRLGMIDVSGISFTRNGADCYLPGNHTVSANTTLPPAAYSIDTSAGPITVPAGVTLTIQPGCRIRNATYQDLLVVQGTLVATGASFDLVTRNWYWSFSGYRQYGTNVFSLAGRGAGRFTDCQFSASDQSEATYSQVFSLTDAASLSLSGCALESTAAQGYLTCYGIVATGGASLTLASSGRARSTFAGFPVAVQVESTGLFSATGTDFMQCGTGMSLRSAAALGARLQDLTFAASTHDCYVTGGFALTGNVALSPVRYDVDSSAGPITVPSGVTLTMPPGSRVRSALYQDLFAVQGTLVATGASFDLVTRDLFMWSSGYWQYGARILTFTGSGAGRFTDCQFSASDQTGPAYSRIFHLADTASLSLSGCALESTAAQGYLTCYGIVATGGASLTLASSGRARSTFAGFPVAVQVESTGLFSATGTDFMQCGTGMSLRSAAALGAGHQGLTFTANAHDCHIVGGFALTGDVTLYPLPYEVDGSIGPITVPAGATLTILPGSRVRSALYQDLFAVQGTLVATGASFDLVTRDLFMRSSGYWQYGARIFAFTGSGAGRFTDCQFSASDQTGPAYSRIFHLADTASLSLSGCALESTTAHGYLTCYAIYVQAAASLTLQSSTILGFPVGICVESVPVLTVITGNDFMGSTSYAVQNLDTDPLPCPDNWWGHPSGPRHSSNPLGVGEAVAGNVILSPFGQSTDMAVLTAANHPAGQAPNAFTAAGSIGNAVLARFALESEGASCHRLVFRLGDVAGLDAANVTNVRLVQDVNADGDWDAGVDLLVAGGTPPAAGSEPAAVGFSAGTISFTADFPANGAFLLLADLVGVASGDTLSVYLSAADLSTTTGVLPVGGMTPAHHFLNRLYVSDHSAGQVGDRFGSAAQQADVTLLAFRLTPGYNLSALAISLTNIQGIQKSNVSGAELILDSDSNGQADPEETVIGSGLVTITGSTGTIGFSFGAPRALFATGGDVILRAGFDGLDRGDALMVELTAAGVTVSDGGVAVAGRTLTARHVVEAPLVLLDAAFQVRNGFEQSSDLNGVLLLGFLFLPQGRRIEGLTFRLTDVYGIAAAEITNARLCRDLDRDGTIEPGETRTVGGPGVVGLDPTTGFGSITFVEPFTGQGDYILLADFANLGLDDTLTVGLVPEDVTVSAGEVVEGGVSWVKHSVFRPDLPEACEQHNWTLTYRSPGGLTVCGSYSHDGTKVILGYSSGAAYIYDANSNTPLLMLHRHYDKVQYAGFSADDKTAITVTRDGAVYLWDVETATLTRNLFSDILVRYAVPSPDCSKLFIVTEGKGMLLDLTTGQRLWEFVQGTTQLYDADYAPDGSKIIVGAADKRAYLLAAATGAIMRNPQGYDLVFQGHSRAVTGCTFAANGTRVLTSSTDATATLWYANDPVHPICTVSLAGQESMGAAVSGNGTRIAMVTSSPNSQYTGYLRLFDEEGRELWAAPLADWNFTGRCDSTAEERLAIDFDPSGARLLLGSNSRNYYAGSSNHPDAALASQFRVADQQFLNHWGPRGMMASSFDRRVRVSEDGKRVFLMHGRGLDVVPRDAGQSIQWPSELGQARGFDVTPDGRKLALMNGRVLQLFTVDSERVTLIAGNDTGFDYDPISLSKSGGLAIVGDHVFRAATGEVFCDSPNVDQGYRNTFAPDGTLWGIAFHDDMSIKTMRTTDDAGNLEYGATLTAPYKPMKILYHPDGIRIGCVDQKQGVQFYRLDNNQPVGLYDFNANPSAPDIADAVLSHDGTMLLIARANSAKLFDVRTGRVVRYFYPLHSGQADCYVRSVAFGAHDNLISLAWSDNYIEMFERSRLVDLQITPTARTLPVGESQEFSVEAVYDDGSRVDVSPRYLRKYVQNPVLAPGARLYADPPLGVTVEESVVTVNPGAVGTVRLTAVYSEGGYTRTAAATVTVGESPLVSLTATPTEVTLTHGVVLPLRYIAEYADGYRADVTSQTALGADQPSKVRIAGNNVTVLLSAGACEVEITGSYTYRGVGRSAVTTIISHGPQSTWEQQWVTSGGDVNAICFSPDGTRMATGGSSGAISIHRVGLTPTQYTLERVIPAHHRPLRFLNYLSNSELVSVGEDGRILTWNLADTSTPKYEFTHDAAITCAAFSSNLLAFGDNLGRVMLLDQNTNSLRWAQTLHDGDVRAVALDSDSVFSGGADEQAVLVRRGDGTVIMRYPGFAKPLVAVGYMGGMTYALAEDKRLATWNKGTEDGNFWEYFFPALPTALNWQNDRLYVCTVDNGVCATWTYDQNLLLLGWFEHPPVQGKITSLKVTPDGNYLITGRATTIVDVQTAEGAVQKLSAFHSCQFWHAGRGSFSGSLNHSYSVTDARITQDGATLFTQCAKRTMKWTYDPGARDGAVKGTAAEAGLPTTAARGSGFKSGSFQGESFLETGYFVPYEFAGLETTNDTAGLLGARVGDSIYIMNMAERLLSQSVHTSCSRFALSPDGRRLITNTTGALTRFWDIAVDFPTVVHENPVYSFDVSFVDSTFTDADPTNDDALGTVTDDEFVSIFNQNGLRFSGIHISIDPAIRACTGPALVEDVLTARNVARAGFVVRQMEKIGETIIWHSYVQVYDASNRLVPIKLFEKYLGASSSGKPKVALALANDGSLCFWGMERLKAAGGLASLSAVGEAANDDLFRGHLVELSTRRELYVFSPPSAGTVSDLGVAAAQFAQDDGALMIAWKEGYAEVCQRQGMSRLELAPVARTLPPGAALDLVSRAVYVDGTSVDVSEHATLQADKPALVTIAGQRITVGAATPLGTRILVTSTYREMGATKTATMAITVGEPTFLSLTVDPPKISLAPGSAATLRFFAHFADGTTSEATAATTVSADPAGRLTLDATTVEVPAMAQPGLVTITGRYAAQGDERSAQAVISVRSGAGTATPGDFDGDRDVDFNDLTFFVGHYGETSASSSWSPACDFDGDGDVDFNDVTYFAGIYGRTYSGRKAADDDPVWSATERGPLVRVWLEGPAGAVTVGEAFQVRVHVQDDSAAASGFRGGPLDILFDPSRASYLQPFDPRVILQPPFNAMITNGSLLEDRLDELGGVTIASGLGDGVPVLYAVLTFRATAAGTAEFSAAAGESGLSLSPPVGQVGSDQVSYGSALAITIRQSNRPPVALDSEVATAVGGVANELYLLQDGTPVLTLAYGIRPDASAAFSFVEGDRLAEPAGADGADAIFVLGSGEGLAADFRGLADRVEWRLALSVPGDGRATWSLGWQQPLDLPLGSQMILVPADDAWQRAGARLDMAQAQSLELAAAGPGLVGERYLLVLERLQSFTFHLTVGWNLIGIPLELTADSQAAFLADPRILAVWGWDPEAGYRMPMALQAQSGYWVFATTGGDIEVRGAAPEDRGVRLAKGWNLVAPGVASGNAVASAEVYPCWGWDVRTGAYAAATSTGDDRAGQPCQPGAAYWVFAPEDGVVIWDQH